MPLEASDKGAEDGQLGKHPAGMRGIDGVA